MGKVTPLRLCSNHNRRASRVTSGRNLFIGGDGRSVWALRWKDLILAHVADLGGPEDLSEAQISICRRVSAVECELEAMEARLSEGQVIDIGVYARLAGLLARLLELIGTKRLTKPLDPTSELVKSMAAYPATAIDDSDEDEPAPIEEPGEG